MGPAILLARAHRAADEDSYYAALNVTECSAFSNDTALFAHALPSAPFGLTPKAKGTSTRPPPCGNIGTKPLRLYVMTVLPGPPSVPPTRKFAVPTTGPTGPSDV